MNRLIVALLLTACAGSADPELDAAEPETKATPLIQRAPFVTVSPEIAEQLTIAFDLWDRATDGKHLPDIVISDECDPDAVRCFVARSEIVDCQDKLPYGCTHGRVVELDVVHTPPQWWVSTLGHEIGHLVGLDHPTTHTNTIMDPERSQRAREYPCVSPEILLEAGLSGPGACVGG
jgi:hypothetical protein